MTRLEAKTTLLEIINSGIINEELEERLNEIVNSLCADDYEPCYDRTIYCEGCKHCPDESC